MFSGTALQANVDGLDAGLASAQARVTAALDRQALQNPGQLVVMESGGQLDGVQTLVGALRNLGFVLPLLVLSGLASGGWENHESCGCGSRSR